MMMMIFELFIDAQLQKGIQRLNDFKNTILHNDGWMFELFIDAQPQ